MEERKESTQDPVLDDSLGAVVSEIRIPNVEFHGCDVRGDRLVLGAGDHLLRFYQWQNAEVAELPHSPQDHHQYSINEVGFSPGGTLVASASTDGTISIVQAQSGELLQRLVSPAGVAVRCCRFSPDATQLATGGDDDTLSVWDLMSGRLIRSLKSHEATIFALAYSPNGQYLVSTDANGAMYLWDGGSIHVKSLAFCEEAHDLGVLTCDISPIKADLRPGSAAYIVATGGNDDLIRLWAIQERFDSVQFVCTKILSGHDGAVMHTRFSHSGALLASGGGDKVVRLWNPVSGTCLKRLSHHERFVTQIAFASDDRTLFSVSNDKSMAVWRLKAPLNADITSRPLHINLPIVESLEHKASRAQNGPDKHVQSFVAHASDVNQVKCLASDTMVSVGSDKFVKLWHRASSDRPWTLTKSAQGHVYPIYSMDFHREKELLVSAGSDGVCLIWNCQTLEVMERLQSDGGIQVCELSPQGDMLATGGDTFAISLWDLKTGKVIRAFNGHEASIYVATFSPDSEFLLSGDSDGQLCLWNAENSHQPLDCVPRGHDLGVLCGKSLPLIRSTGQIFVTGGNDALVKVWRWDEINAKLLLERELKGHGESVMSVAFSDNGEMMATSSGDKTVRVWVTSNWSFVQALSGHKRYVNACTFGFQDHSQVITGSNDKTIRVWKLHVNHRPHFSNHPITDWQARDVTEWFESKGVKAEHACAINGPELLNMNVLDFENILGLEERAAIEFVQEIQHLRFKKTSNAGNFSELNVDDGQDIPHEFICPITQDVMSHPVKCQDGFTYEKAAITEWFLSRRATSPMTNLPIQSTSFVDDTNLKEAILKFFHETRLR